MVGFAKFMSETAKPAVSDTKGIADGLIKML